MLRMLTGTLALGLIVAAAPVHACGPNFVEFASGSDRPEAVSLAVLDIVVATWRRQRGARIVLRAGTDRVGPAASNLQLSRRRGAAVKRELIRRGVPAALIAVEATGEPADSPDGVADAFQRTVFLSVIPAGSPRRQTGC